VIDDHEGRDIATANAIISRMKRSIPPKEPIREPEMRSQKELNCWQNDDQLAFALPLYPKYTVAAAAEAPAVRRVNITLITKFELYFK
jgi:hypothetical protein